LRPRLRWGSDRVGVFKLASLSAGQRHSLHAAAAERASCGGSYAPPADSECGVARERSPLYTGRGDPRLSAP
jgi:hypothetical protein